MVPLRAVLPGLAVTALLLAAAAPAYAGGLTAHGTKAAAHTADRAPGTGSEMTLSRTAKSKRTAKATRTAAVKRIMKPQSVQISLLHGCSAGSVVAYSARGSGEPIGADEDPSTGDPDAALLYQLQTFSFPNLTAYTDGYPAVPWYDWVRAGGSSYKSSVTQGTNLGLADLAHYMSLCPASRFLLIGYSQGADVIRNIVTSRQFRSSLARVSQVVLFGDPHFSPHEPGVLKAGSYRDNGTVGSATGGLIPIDNSLGPWGILAESGQQIGETTPHVHVLSWCDSGDPVCQGLGTVNDPDLFDKSNPHFNYNTHQYDASRVAAHNLIADGAVAGVAAPPTVNSSPGATTCGGYCVLGTSEGLHSYVSPSTSSPVVSLFPELSLLSIVCQARGGNVGGSTVWDQLADGSWVSDFYTNTPRFNAFSPPLPQCGGVTAPPTAPVAGPPPAGTTRYYVKGTGGIGLHARSVPAVSGRLLGTYAEGAALDIACQSLAADVVQGSNVWDQLADGSWVSDFYTTTPNFDAFSPPIPQCATTPPVTPPVPAPPTDSSGGQTTYQYAVSGTDGIGLTERQGPSTAGPSLAVDADGAPLEIVCQDHGDVVRGSGIWDKLADGNWVSDFYTTTPVFNGFSAPIPQCPPPVTPPPASGVDREAVTSYDQMRGGAPYHGYFVSAWQGFVAQSNTLTHLGVTVGNPNVVAGTTSSTTVNVKLCLEASCAHVLASVSPQIVNYGNTYADIGDVPVTPGAIYYLVYYQPVETAGATWVTYWWAGGPGIAQSDQMQAIAKGYNQ